MRTHIRHARSVIPSLEQDQASSAIRDVLLTVPELEMASSIAAYVSVGNEPGTRSLLFALWKRGSYVLLPVVRPDGELDWASYEGPDSLREGPYGLLEPTEPVRGVDAIKATDVVLVPALAVDRHGRRLGRGGGFYDRALARVGPAILTVGVVYDAEFLEEVPAEPHDVPVRAVATPSGFHRLGTGPGNVGAVP
ncbi:5-formyltetrahydrofolate cyclo-ligase [Actinocorallia herbida]|uniref:5-formyltetrahydrofolate cyclo-ligase n=1 Tax=Actinocorallia herbida TaxID=58109 RepID=A0A3N1DCS5_9ACTN|nr:5-formyltetrahydrofolate cyclo-ligase [Actinocorallia herbida]ROO91321.1 5-formyltetrahydrofolate cyclo-ligase [Actinocorallia herbida]